MSGQTNTGEITGPICRNGWAKKNYLLSYKYKIHLSHKGLQYGKK